MGYVDSPSLAVAIAWEIAMLVERATREKKRKR